MVFVTESGSDSVYHSKDAIEIISSVDQGTFQSIRCSLSGSEGDPQLSVQDSGPSSQKERKGPDIKSGQAQKLLLASFPPMSQAPSLRLSRLLPIGAFPFLSWGKHVTDMALVSA